MLKPYLLLIFICCSGMMHAQVHPAWQWTAYGENSAAALTRKVALDRAGNTYVAGNFSGYLILGDSTFTAQGKTDIFIARYSAAGKLQWATQVRGAAADELRVYGLAVDFLSGELYIGGTFKNGILFSSTAYPSNGMQDVFLAKYTAAGKVAWEHTYGSQYDDYLGSISLSNNHKLAVTGAFAVAAIPGQTIVFGNDTLTASGDASAFLLQCNDDGSINWASSPESRNPAYGWEVATHGSDIYFVGIFSLRITLGNTVLNSISTGIAGGDIFVARYDSLGQVTWARAIGCIGPASGHDFGSISPGAIAADTAGNLIVTGSADNGGVMFDPAARNTDVLGRPSWMVKYVPGGQFLWTRGVDQRIGSISCDHAGAVYLTGSYGGNCVFGMDTLSVPPGRNANYLYVAQYSAMAGKAVWGIAAGGIADAYGGSIACGAAGEIVVAGSVAGGSSATFGGLKVLDYSNAGNGFVARLGKGPLGVAGAQQSTSAQIFPNPSKGSISIRQPFAGAFDTYRLTDMQGRQLNLGALPAKQTQTLQLPGYLPAGVYYLQLSGETGSSVHKLLLER